MELAPPPLGAPPDLTVPGLADLVSDATPADAAPLARPLVPPRHDAAEAALAAYDVRGYAGTRNHLDGNVSRLSPWITWGALSLPEVQAAVEARHPVLDRDLAKFLDELGWKAYARAWFGAYGARVLAPIEPYKYPTSPKRRGPPPGALDGTTGLPCIDRIVRELRDTGYLHNHARMYFAAWWVHVAGHDPRDGEVFFRRHLLDGEPGPNALGWQWVASTFGGKPYLANAANMRRNGLDGCEGTVLDASDEALAERYLGGHAQGGYARRPKDVPRSRPGPRRPELTGPATDAPAVLLHAERLSLRAAPVLAYPDRPVVVVLDRRRLELERPAAGRLAFALGLAGDLVRRLRDEGRDARLLLAQDEDEVATLVRAQGADGVVAPGSWHPGTWTTLARLHERLPVRVEVEPAYADVDAPLRSFSAWWSVARPTVLDRSVARRSEPGRLLDS
jgi:deoxyribodipyrimidine photo-lyase